MYSLSKVRVDRFKAGNTLKRITNPLLDGISSLLLTTKMSGKWIKCGCFYSCSPFKGRILLVMKIPLGQHYRYAKNHQRDHFQLILIRQPNCCLVVMYQPLRLANWEQRNQTILDQCRITWMFGYPRLYYATFYKPSQKIDALNN